ncbi:hypothetical protein GCM10022384_70860 [Streptomyces marokkonensis]|uniref:Uncharacterized protein n=1 Tax=Streptomyces marokkonensis TaxID=324855 RepID=A0ABP7T1Q2_9ACTN
MDDVEVGGLRGGHHQGALPFGGVGQDQAGGLAAARNAERGRRDVGLGGHDRAGVHAAADGDAARPPGGVLWGFEPAFDLRAAPLRATGVRAEVQPGDDLEQQQEERQQQDHDHQHHTTSGGRQLRPYLSHVLPSFR